MLTRARKIHLTHLSHAEKAELKVLCWHAARMYNVALYEVRQQYRAEKTHLNDYANYHRVKQHEHYRFLGKNFATKLIQQVEKDYQSFFAALKIAKGHSNGDDVDVHPPFYKAKEGYFHLITQIGNGFVIKGDHIQIGLSKQALAQGMRRVSVPLPYDIPVDAVREVRIIPNTTASDFHAILVYHLPQTPPPPVKDFLEKPMLTLDPGMNNLLAMVDFANARSFLISGRPLKAINYHYNQERDRLKSIQMRQDTRPCYELSSWSLKRLARKELPSAIYAHCAALEGTTYHTAEEIMAAIQCSPDECAEWKTTILQQTTIRKKFPETAKLYALTQHRNNQIRDYMRKVAHTILDYCETHHITTIVAGKNKGQKKESALSKKVNRNYVPIPFVQLYDYLRYGGERRGIAFLEQQESHTSKCSFLDEEDVMHQDEYAGKRIQRGLFRTKTGDLVNADANGAANIGVKAGWQGDRARLLHALQCPMRWEIALD